jgi:bifunctional ADP-heptose synthase (sugar kinase/adenylyltransferase)
MDKKIMKKRVICSKEDWIRMDREEAARKECELNKKKKLFDTELKINLFRIGGFKNE